MEPRLVRGQGGIFDVALDGALLFSKHRDGAFPAEEEVVARLKEKAGRQG